MLSCSCSDDTVYFYDPSDSFIEFNELRRKRCKSCKTMIDHLAPCLKFNCYRDTRGSYEENRFGDTIEMAPQFLCEKCGEIYLNLKALGYCYCLGTDINEDLHDYWDLTGFTLKGGDK